MQRLEPLTINELGESAEAVKRWKVYGIVRRSDLDANVLEAMRQRKKGTSDAQIACLRIRKSRRWSLAHGFPQLAWDWRAAFDFGPYKSEYNGKHDLDGGRLCDLCHTWMRFGHLLTHDDWPGEVIVGQTCAVLLSDLDPDWAEKKLKQEFTLRLQKQRERERLEVLRLQQERARNEERLHKALADQREAQEIAAAMLRDYSLREQGVPCRVLPSTPGQDLLEAATDPAWRELCQQRQKAIAMNLPVAVSQALYRANTGNWTFHTEVTAIPISGTVFRCRGGWKAVVRHPGTVKAEFLPVVCPTWNTCCDEAVSHLIRALSDYAATLHANEHHPWRPSHAGFLCERLASV